MGQIYDRLCPRRQESAVADQLSILLTPAAIFRTRERTDACALTYLRSKWERARLGSAFTSLCSPTDNNLYYTTKLHIRSLFI